MKIKKSLNLLNATSDSIAQSFYQGTKIKKFAVIKNEPNQVPESWKKISYKAYPRFPQIILPEPTSLTVELTSVLKNRRSIRSFSTNKISIENFSNLVYYSCGSTKFYNPTKEDRRFYPSAGARYPLEVYPFVFNVNTIEPGGYHYHVKSHSLEQILNQKFSSRIFHYFDQEWIEHAAAIFIVTAEFGRTAAKYGNRGYRHIFTEYGHMAQNIYSIAGAINLGCCSIGGFLEDGINRLLELDFEDEGVIGVIALGEPAAK